VLTARQMGKSSLMVRVSGRLKEEGVAVAILDITALGQNLTPDQWYEGLLMRLAEQLDLEDEAEDFWDEHRELPPLQRWMRAVRDVVMARRTGRIVIFIDEIDFVRSLNFPTDEFFAAIRECYNRRAVEPDYNRLTFCLIGVATPSDLIRDNRTTPFNIGRRIELPDFTQEQAEPLAKGLGREPVLARRLIDRVLHWTGGHPYLTQRLCKVVAEDASVRSPADVDRLCTDLFLGHRAKERDDNLIFVRDRMLRNEADRAALLELYRRMWEGREVPDDETNPLVAILRLSGIARVVDGRLRVRNRIYAHVFDKTWVVANMPDAELRRQRAAYRRGLVRASIAAAGVILAIGVGIYAYLYVRVLEYTDYYAAAMLQHGLPEGTVHLTSDQASHRNISYRVHRRGRWGRITRIEAVNGHDDPTVGRFGRHFRATSARDAWSGESEWRFGAYDEGGAVYEQAFNRYGKTIWNLLYSPVETREQSTPMKRQQSPADQVVQARFVNSDDYAVLRLAGQYLEFTYDEKGHEKAVRFTNFVHGPEVGSQHATQIDQKFDANGRATEMTFTFPPPKTLRGEPSPAPIEPPVTLSLTYERELLVQVKRTRPENADGCARIDLKYDDYGNLTEEKFFDDQGNPTTNEGPMRRVAEALFAPPAFDPDGPHGRFHGWKAEYNSFGDMTKVQLLGVGGAPAQDANGFDHWVANYDGHGNCVRRDYFDATRGLIAHVRYDGHGAEVERAHTTTEGHPTSPSPRGGTTTTRTYYDNGQRSSEITSGFDVQTLGFARCERAYDREGHETAVKFLDANGTPLTDVPTQCVVVAVMPGTRAEAVYGLQPGDVITEYAGSPVHQPADFYQATWRKMQAQEWSNPLKLMRHGKETTVNQVFAIESGAVLASELDPSYHNKVADAPDGLAVASEAHSLQQRN
jgi:hypothetical protein